MARALKQNFLLETPDFPFDMFEGRGQIESDENFFLHNHDCLELNYAVRGNGTYIIGDHRYPIRQGDLFVINNCEYHMAVNDGGLLLKVIIFDTDIVWQNNNLLDYKYLQTFFEWKSNFRHRFLAENLMVEYIATIFYELEHEWEQKQMGYQLVIKALLLKILALLYRGFALEKETSQKVLKFQIDYNRIMEAIAYIDKNYCQPIDLKSLSELTHLSPNYFSSIFNNVMSASLSDYVNKKRVDHACRLLRTTKMNICEIALKSGFNDISHFNKVFKKVTKVSPKQYREQK